MRYTSGLVLATFGTLAVASAAQAAVFAPVAVTGYNYDVIVEAGKATFALAQTATFDGGPSQGGNTFSALGANTGNPLAGLPAGSTFVSSLDAGHSFALAAANVNNAIQLSKTTAAGTLTFTTPAAYAELAFAVSGGWDGGTVGYTINYAGGTTATGNIIVSDWSNAGGIYDAKGRTSGLEGNLEPLIGNITSAWSLFEQVIAVDAAKSISSINFGYVTTGNNTPAIFAVSGAVPEPTSLALAGLGGLSLLARRRR